MTKNRPKIGQQITKVFEELVDEYLHESKEIKKPNDNQKETQSSINDITKNNEYTLIKNFLSSPCSCKKSCKENLSFDEIAKARKEFSSLNWNEKNVFILSQLEIFVRHSNKTRSARQTKIRVRQKFDYHISIDRPVCKEVYLFYHAETTQRLKRLQNDRLEVGIPTTTHGNTGRSPIHAGSLQDKDDIKKFIINYAAAHGMPDPGRDLRHGKGRLRILLPSVLNYTSVHHAYELSKQSQNKPSVGYCTFIHYWQANCPHIVFEPAKN